MKRFAVLMMVVFVFVAALPTYAQQVVPCYDLSAEDCAIVTNSTVATASLTGLSVEFQADIALTGLGLAAALGSEPVEDVFMNVVGSGDIDLSQGSPAFSFDIVLTSESQGESVALTVSVVDGALYLVTPEGAVGVNLDATTLAELGLPADFLTNSPSTLGELLMIEETATVASPEDLSALDAYVTYGRADDNEAGDAVFSFHLDITALLNSPEVSEILSQLGGFAGDNEEAAMILAFVPMLVSLVESEIGVEQAINADGYVTNFYAVFYLGADLGAFIAPDAGLDPVEVAAELSFDFSNFDAPNAIVAPENATFLTAEEVQQLLGSFAP